MSVNITISKRMLAIILLIFILLIAFFSIIVDVRAHSGSANANFILNQAMYFEKSKKDFVRAHAYYTAYYFLAAGTLDSEYESFYLNRIEEIRKYINSEMEEANYYKSSLDACYKKLDENRIAYNETVYFEQPPQFSKFIVPPDMVLVCEDQNYQGYCEVFPIGTYNKLWQNDVISSFQVGEEVVLRVCYGNDISTPCQPFESNVPNLSNKLIGSWGISWDNNIRSLEVYK